MSKSIWFGKPTIAGIMEFGKNTMSEAVGIEMVEIGEDFLRGRMPVDHRTKQPAGLLHGGASAVLAETLGSVAGSLVIDMDKRMCVGLEINANHISGCRDGFVEGVVRPVHLGRSTQVWDIRITQESRLICVSRLTLAVLERK